MKKLAIDKDKLTKLEPSRNPFQSLVHSIISQQLSSKSARTIYGRFVSLWSDKKFPKPQDVLSASDDQLRAVGLSRGKIVYIRDLAEKFLDGTIDPRKFNKMSDQEIIDHLIQVKGIGEWTAHMFLIFALNRPDILPTGDLAIRKGFMKAYNLKAMPTVKEMKDIAEEHSGARTDLALHLWAIMDGAEGGW